MSSSWDGHYTAGKSELLYPDENLVRLVTKFLAGRGSEALTALDMGCGTGRHLKLLDDLGVAVAAGMDISHRGLVVSRHFSSTLFRADNRSLPLKSDSIDIAIAWGSLHYASKDDLAVMISEILRVVRPGGRLFATLRSSRDTHLKKGSHLGNDTWITDLADIEGSLVSFYREDEVRNSFATFASCEIGLIERSLMGDLSRVLSHWVIDAER
jgi:SAM-dependent methyltransferase